MDKVEIYNRLTEELRKLGREGADLQDVMQVLRVLHEEADWWTNPINVGRTPFE